ncbi:Nn.00g026360.m01.CDS01 [Neocucurbitaria sp. VM-36]
MSADLFAEFGEDSGSNQPQQAGSSARTGANDATTFSFFDGLDTAPAPDAHFQAAPSQQQQFQSFNLAPNQATTTDDNDDWGDFEGGSSLEPAPPVKSDPFAFAPQQVPKAPQKSWNTNSAAQDLFTLESSQPALPSQGTWQSAPIVKAKKSADPSVLFDAEDDLDDDDDFGDFEGTGVTKQNPPISAAGSSALVDLLGDSSVSQPQLPVNSRKDESSASRVPRAISSAKKGPAAGFGVVAKPKHPSTTAASTVQQEDDAWDTFDDWEASIPTKALAKGSSKPKVARATITAKTSVSPAPILSPTTDDPQPGELPPTNVPPPGVLLSLFPSLFADAQEKLFKPMAAQTLPTRNKMLAENATVAYLQGYLILANVAAHIVAGRKLRWKRDQHLSQGMRIGPASSRATSGMKLTGIDKGENMKEEREVSDVVRVWKEQVGRLRHVISGANQIKAGTLGPAPDLQETMPVKTLKQSEGGIPARQPCMLCGLKRDERVTASDLAVDDSFGEWWIDQVNMHRGCRNFWNEHRDRLRQH